MHHYIAIQNTYDVFEMALFIDNAIVDHLQEDKRHTSKMFIPLIDQLCARNNINFSDVSFLAVNCGPGPFSTLRSIIASVNGLHAGLNIPLIGIDGLDATFIELYDNSYQNTVVLLNAFNNEVYYLIAHQDKIMAKGYKKIDLFLQELLFSRAHPDASTLLSSKQPCLASEAFGEGRLEGFPRALEETLLPQFSFYSKPGSPSEGTDDGVKQVQGERKQEQKISHQIHFIGNGVTLHQDLIKEILDDNAVIKQNNPPMCSLETIGRLGLEKFKHGNKSDEYLMPLHLKKHAVEL